MSKQTISIRWLNGIAELLRSNGMDVAELFHDAGLDIACLNDVEARCATDQVSALWELAAVRSGNPALGLAVPEVLNLGNFDVVAYVMTSCPDLRSAIRRLAHYFHVISEPATLLVMENQDECWVTLDIASGTIPVPRQRIEHALVSILALCRAASGQALRPLVVHLSHSPPAHLEPYYKAFGCPLRFNAPDHRMRFALSDLALPLPGYSPVMAELHARYADKRLERLGSSKIASQVRHMIVRQLPDGDPLRTQIAHALSMGESTLQRRLREEGTSFQQLVNEVRRDLARKYLGQNHIALGQVAYLLGYSDPGVFGRRCRRWLDMSPQQYRTLVAPQ